MKKQTRNKKKSGKKIYRVKNWAAYNEALKQCGSLNVWIGEEVLRGWVAKPTGQIGAPKQYADMAIEVAWTIRKLFRLPFRQTEGFLVSLFVRLDLALSVPDYTTLSRRARSPLGKLSKSNKKITDIVIDGSGVKVYGEGEWKVKKHGPGRRRKWKKIHIGIDADGEIRMGEVTDATTVDAAMIQTLLDQETATIASLTGDGAYDTTNVYQACQKRHISDVLIPPRKDATIWQHGNLHNPPHPRDANLRVIRKLGRAGWKMKSGYHRRSLIESTMFRFKTIFGERSLSREDSRITTELKLAFSILNRMFELGMPDSYVVNV